MYNHKVSPGPGSYLLPSEFGYYQSKKGSLFETRKKENQLLHKSKNSESTKLLGKIKYPKGISNKQLKQIFSAS